MSATKILIIGAENSIAMTLRLPLEEMGYTVATMTTIGEETIQRVTKMEPDLALLTLDAEDELVDAEIAQEIRDHLGVALIYVADSAEDILLQAQAHDPSGYLIAPFNEEKLRLTIELALSKHQLKQDLRESEEQYSSLIEQSEDAIYLLYEDKFEMINPKFEELFGLSNQEACAPDFDFRSLVAPNSQSLIKERRQALARGEKVSPHYEFTALDRDGREIEAEISVSYVPYKGGTATQGILRDITDRKQMERALRERTEQLEALRKVELEITSELNLDELLRSIVSRAVELVDGTVGGFDLYRPEQDLLDFAIHIGYETLPDKTTTRRGEGLAGKVWESGKTIIVDDYAAWEGQAAVWTEHLGHFADIGVPVHWSDQFLGVLEVMDNPPRTFSQSDAGLLELFANQAAIAIRNAQLYEETRRRAAQATVLYEVGRKVSSELELDTLLSTIVSAVRDTFDYHNVALLLLDEETNQLTMKATTGAYANTFRRISLTVGEGMVGYAAASKKTQVSNDVTTNPHYVRKVEEDTRSEMTVPIISNDEVIGVLDIQDDEQDVFDQTDVDAMEILSTQIAVAIENARLYEKIRKYAGVLEKRVTKRTEQLRAQYGRLEAILHNTGDGIVVTGIDGELILANPVAHTWLTQTLSPEEADQLRAAIQEMGIQSTQEPERVLELTGLDLQLKATPVDGPRAQGAVAVVAIHDVSYLKALDRMKSRFITNVSHELRTPLATVKAYAHLLRTQPNRREDHLKAIDEEIDHLTRLVEDITRISQVDAGRIEIKATPTDLNTLTDMAIHRHKAHAQKRNLSLEHCPMVPAPKAMVDQQQIAQALDRILSNALRYTPAGGLVTISTAQKELKGRLWVTIAVKDTGIGIPKEELPHIFERFFRGERAHILQYPGTGLGLAIAKGIVELHGGQVTVKSEVGVGSTFTMWLPRARTCPTERAST